MKMFVLIMNLMSLIWNPHQRMKLMNIVCRRVPSLRISNITCLQSVDLIVLTRNLSFKQTLPRNESDFFLCLFKNAEWSSGLGNKKWRLLCNENGNPYLVSLTDQSFVHSSQTRVCGIQMTLQCFTVYTNTVWSWVMASLDTNCSLMNGECSEVGSN